MKNSHKSNPDHAAQNHATSSTSNFHPCQPTKHYDCSLRPRKRKVREHNTKVNLSPSLFSTPFLRTRKEPFYDSHHHFRRLKIGRINKQGRVEWRPDHLVFLLRSTDVGTYRSARREYRNQYAKMSMYRNIWSVQMAVQTCKYTCCCQIATCRFYLTFWVFA